MDKFAMKGVLAQAGIPVLEARQYTGKQYAVDSEAVLTEIETAIGYPVIVKPVNLGSSVGISKAKDRASLVDAMDLAVSFSSRVLVERAVPNLREINCSVLGDYETARPSACEEPLNAEDILTFGDKYLSGNGGKSGGSKGMTDLKRRCPADLPAGMTERVQELAVATFKALGCMGVSRIDFLNDKETGELWVNEINTIPGSLSFYLWQEVGVSFEALMDELVSLAFKRQREREALTFTYESNILSGVMLRDRLVRFSGRDFDCVDFGFDPNEPVDVVVRPEDVDIVPAESGQLRGTVTSVTFLGVYYEIIVDIDGFKWMIQTTDFVDVYEHIGLKIDPDAIHIMDKSEYSGMFGDYSSFSEEYDELSQAESGAEA
jgi:D-alanine--D-alanine ligase